MTKALAIVRTSRQMDAVLSIHPGTVIVASNRATYRVALTRGFACRLLSEALLDGCFREINSWAFEQTFAMMGRKSKDPDVPAFLETHFTGIKAVFAQALKSALAIQKILNEEEANELLVFDSTSDTLAAVCRSGVFKNINVRILKDEANGSPRRIFSIKTSLRVFLARWVTHEGYRRLTQWKTSGERILIASGSLKYLRGSLESVAAQGMRVAFVENIFNGDKYNFCRRHQMVYLILPEPSPRSFAGKLPEIKASFKEHDLSKAVRDLMEIAVRSGYLGHLSCPFSLSTIRALFREYGAEAALLDEDAFLRRIFSVAAWETGKESYVVSHGAPAVPVVNAGARSGAYRSGFTFIGSELERETYESIHFEPHRLLLTGLPQHDRIPELKALPKPLSTRKTVLYCGSSFDDFYGFDEFLTIIGVDNFLKEATLRYWHDTAQALKGRSDLKVMIKPHYNDEKKWHAAVRASGLDVEIVSHRLDILDLIHDVDVVVTPESTVILESILMEKPVVILHYPKEPISVDYGDLVEFVGAKEGILPAISRCLEDEQYRKDLSRRRREAWLRFAGALDGKASERIAKCILTGLEMPLRVPATVV